MHSSLTPPSHVRIQDKRRVGDWDLDEWRAQEPKNCHSHLLSMLLGNTLMLPVTGGQLAIGAWERLVVMEGGSVCVITYLGHLE